MTFAALIPMAVIVALPLLFFIVRVKKKVTHWLLVVYIGVLLLSVVAAFFIKSDEPEITDRPRDYLYEMLYSGEIYAKGSNLLLKEDSFPIEGEKVRVTSSYGDESSSVYIERKTEDDQKMDVLAYGSFSIAKLDVAEEIVLPAVQLKDGTLTIVYPEYQKLKTSIVMNEFTIEQFTGNKKYNSEFQIDGPILLVRIPPDLEIEADSTTELISIDEWK